MRRHRIVAPKDPLESVEALAHELLTLRGMTPLERAKVLPSLISRSQGVLSYARKSAVYEATRTLPYKEVAAQLLTTKAAVNVTVTGWRRAVKDAVGA
jgi:hypothetical protein